MALAVEMQGVTKKFGDFVANENIDFQLEWAEIMDFIILLQEVFLLMENKYLYTVPKMRYLWGSVWCNSISV